MDKKIKTFGNSIKHLNIENLIETTPEGVTYNEVISKQLGVLKSMTTGHLVFGPELENLLRVSDIEQSNNYGRNVLRQNGIQYYVDIYVDKADTLMINFNTL